MQTHAIKLMDREFKIRSAEDIAHIEAVAKYVNGTIDDVRGETKHVPIQSLLLLATMSMADELFKERARIDSLKEKIRSQSRVLLDQLDS